MKALFVACVVIRYDRPLPHTPTLRAVSLKASAEAPASVALPVTSISAAVPARAGVEVTERTTQANRPPFWKNV